MSTTKQRPHELGCTRPYTLSAKGKLLVNEAERVEMHAFIATYRQSGQKLLELFLGWWREGGDPQIIAVLLILPARIAPSIEESNLWRNVQAEAGKVAAGGWPALVGQRLYHFLRTMAGVKGRAASGPEMMARLLGRLKLPPLGLNEQKFAEIFGVFPSEKFRTKLTSQVAGILRAFFSQAENARRSNQEKIQVLADFRGANREFFDGLERLIRAQAAWQRSCRSLGPTRRRLIREGSIPVATVNACQIQAIRERADLISWQAMLDSPPPASINELAKCAAKNRRVVEDLLRALPSSDLPDGIEEGVIRHFATARRLRELARAPYFAQRVLELYDRHVERFAAGQREVILRVEKYGRRTIHVGWQELIDAKSPSPLTAARKFFLHDVMAFCGALQQMRTSTLAPEQVAIWPMLEEQKQWRTVKKQPLGVGNAIEIEFRLPAFLDRPERVIPMVLRGHIPFAQAQPLREPVSVLDGPFQFRPNETLKVDGDPARKNYIKAQGLWLISAGGELFARIGIRRITESIRSISPKLSAVPEFSDSERIAVLHLCPGGMRLGTFTIFEHRAGRWRMHPVQEISKRSDTDAYTHQGDRWVNVRNRGPKVNSHLHFDLHSLCLALDAQIGKLASGRVGKISLAANRAAIAEITPVRGKLSEVWLRRVARRIELALAANGVSRLIVAGRGRIYTRDNLLVPVRKFFSLESVAGRKEAAGYLASSARKAGVTIHTISSRFALIDSKGYSPGARPVLLVGLPCRFLKRGEDGFNPDTPIRTGQGIPQHLYLPQAPGRLIDYYRNGAESILRAWVDKEFRAGAAALLKKIDVHHEELPRE